MTYWNHRLIRHTTPTETLLVMYEVYYGERDQPEMFGSADVRAENLDGVQLYLDWMLAALDKPILTPSDFGISEEEAMNDDVCRRPHRRVRHHNPNPVVAIDVGEGPD